PTCTRRWCSCRRAIRCPGWATTSTCSCRSRTCASTGSSTGDRLSRSMLDSLVSLISDAWWTYPFLFLFALLDSVIPLIPSETAVITAGVGAATGNLILVLVIVVAAVGAVCGDNIAYEIGKRAQPWIDRRFSGPKAAARLAWARRLLHTRGAGL